jgi:dynein heavy chain
LLGEVTAIREENDESGPAAELEYWKSRMAKFNSITDQLRNRKCKIVLGTLKAAKSSLLNQWQIVDVKITDAANEAKV